jgi:hypothetical protein
MYTIQFHNFSLESIFYAEPLLSAHPVPTFFRVPVTYFCFPIFLFPFFYAPGPSRICNFNQNELIILKFSEFRSRPKTPILWNKLSNSELHCPDAWWMSLSRLHTQRWVWNGGYDDGSRAILIGFNRFVTCSRWFILIFHVTQRPNSPPSWKPLQWCFKEELWLWACKLQSRNRLSNC